MVLKVGSDIELRKLELKDATDIFKTINKEREYLGKWLPFVEYTKELKDTEGFVNSVVGVSEDKLEYTFTIRRQDKFIGLIGLKDTDVLNKKTEVGYWLSEEEQGKGIMTKSVKEICNLAFTELQMNRIQIKCAVGNIPSKNIPKRLGFKLEGVEREGELLTGNLFTDLEVYSKLKND
ncbi:GNAT family N-acetyltransferase [Tenacibaculum larymnensis]|uniref:GNAT family N-acetyltransferase n=1 Tax=Tenacibaculum larymnensis TaxID=2878201 RepID=A0A9X4EM20_9FLAO|nr:GNAT family protein [Tenacibaculum larymnensis]MDE1206539.1 GNAT family N-acetyltransferase [Tenacibaculum larymnensis]